MAKVLLVEDEPNLAFSLKLNLEAEGYEVIHADDGRKAIEIYDSEGPFNLVLLDVMLPQVDGFAVGRHIRSKDARIGILMLTARAGDEDRIKGLEIGADDYITKPFHLAELLLRVKRMSERADMLENGGTPEADNSANPIIKQGPFTLNADSLEFDSPGGKHILTALEADVIKEFLTNPNKVLSRTHLLENVWKVRGEVETRTVDNFIMRIRKLMEIDPKKPEYLQSIRGRGYCFRIEK